MNDLVGFDTLQLRLVAQVAMAMALGATLGWEREQAGKAAGLRTHMLVAGAAALLVDLSVVLVERLGKEIDGAPVTTDPMRVIEAIIAGISFLGAGTIMRRKDGEDVQGLTTAATLLLTATIGVCVALSQTLAALGVTALVLATLRLIAWVESRSVTR
jgi:putative Mg2+ transporter-C (MgtC) family protein